MAGKDEIFAYIKYEGELVSSGYLDARKSGEALLGADELLRYFITQEYPQIREYEYELPVKVIKGSWEIVFPENIESLAFKAFGLWAAGKYVGSALEEIAKKDFENVSFKKVIEISFRNIIKVIKIAKHQGTLLIRKFEKVKFLNNNELVEITNSKGEKLLISPDALELYTNCPQIIFNKLAKIIEIERELVIGLAHNIDQNERIGISEKFIFTKTDEEEELILEELVHGQYVELQGHITRGNESSNTIGFLYSGHIITCYPDNGNVKNQKNNMFSNCILKGFVERLDKQGKVKEKRPRIRFIEIINLERNSPDLFTINR